MKPFTKKETLSVIIIFLVLIGISVPNFMLSFRRARDQARRNDIGAISDALDAYKEDFKIFPYSSLDGKIVACIKEGEAAVKDEKGRTHVNFVPCQWGESKIVDPTAETKKIYLELLSQDPDSKKGATYIYISDGERYQILTALEGADEPEYDPKIIARGITCGLRICNAGKFNKCPVDKSLEECQEDDRLKLLKLNGKK